LRNNADIVTILIMNSDQFNESCRRLRGKGRARIYLITGRIIEGELLGHIEAGAREGSLELDTGKGIARFPSGAIDRIEIADDLRA
jgi:hypothetical protein